MLQLELFTDEITVSHIVWDNGREVLMHYRRDDSATSRFLRWQYRPNWREEWRYVQAPRIISNLDNGVHPRTGEYVTVPGIIERMTQGEYERAWELMKDTVWEY
jgi:hypothetical protein